LADLMEAHAEELALLEILDTGKPIRHSLRDDIPGAAFVATTDAGVADWGADPLAFRSNHPLADSRVDGSVHRFGHCVDRCAAATVAVAAF
ncbi:Aldehyde dehydrogenase PuuC, partial [human gut metagenome]